MIENSVYTDVYFDKENNKWISSITINNEKKYLGNFDNKLEALKAYQNELKPYLFLKLYKKLT